MRWPTFGNHLFSYVFFPGTVLSAYARLSSEDITTYNVAFIQDLKILVRSVFGVCIERGTSERRIPLLLSRSSVPMSW